MLFTFARVSAVVGMNADDYYQIGETHLDSFARKGWQASRSSDAHTAEEYLDAYLAALPSSDSKSTPLFFTAVGKTGQLSSNRLSRNDALRMIKRVEQENRPV